MAKSLERKMGKRKSLERKMGKRKSEERKSFAFPFFAFSFSPRKNLQFFLVSCVKDSQCRVLNTGKFSLSWRRKTRKKLEVFFLDALLSFFCIKDAALRVFYTEN
uniref:Uncharacterized protein n=1 Tax=Chaetophora sp. FACHB-2423 TaxID=2725789 RepID=A0A6H1XDU6_9CHLO|nr:hypothetical protein [Chaetophora sp. FACHB-2423]